jgi:Holliday junction resolvasome RuvABC ATP-dependent DNA helicase subunit
MAIKIHKNFDKIVGQNRIKHILSASINAADDGRGDLIQPLVLAPKGTGKTQIVNGYMDALESREFKVLRYSSPSEIRLAGEGWDEFVDTVNDYDTPYAIFFDEIHEIWDDNTRNMRILFAFLRKALDRTNEGRTLTFSDSFTTQFDRKKNVICGTTNYPSRMDEAVVDRFDKIELDLYSENELKEILAIMLESEGMDVESDLVLRLIANCGRGTARPIKNIVRQLVTLYGTEEPISYENALLALKLLSLFPKGLTKSEVDLLTLAQHHPIRDNQFLAMNPKTDPSDLRFSKGYLTSPTVNFVSQTSQGMVTTSRGKAYLKLLQDKGFLDSF